MDSREKVIMVYWAGWSRYRGAKQFQLKDVHSSLFTHFIWAFFKISDNGELTFIDNTDHTIIKDVIALKRKNPQLKILISVGGWAFGSKVFSGVSASAPKRNRFITTAVQFLMKHGFDGLDISWHYPAQYGGRKEDVQNFIILLKEMKKALCARNLLLTVAVAAASTSASISYDIPKLAEEVDFISVMAYDFTVLHENTLQFGSPLDGLGPNTTKASVEYWLHAGAPANKLLMGLSFYGNSFTLRDPSLINPGDPCKGLGIKGPYVEQGKLAYFEIYEKLKEGWKRSPDANPAPYAYNHDQWVSYEDEQSIGRKMEYLKSPSVNLRGVAVWTLDVDDFQGKCGMEYPLLTTIKRKIQ